nr:hypothetical protein [uncultured Mitsuokella sp.]
MDWLTAVLTFLKDNFADSRLSLMGGPFCFSNQEDIRPAHKPYFWKRLVQVMSFFIESGRCSIKSKGGY